MIDDEIVQQLGLNKNHRFELKSSYSNDKGGWDADIDTYEEFDENGDLIRIFTVRDKTKKYPPFTRRISRVVE